MTRPVLYVSGPVTGMPDDNREAFERAADDLMACDGERRSRLDGGDGGAAAGAYSRLLHRKESGMKGSDMKGTGMETISIKINGKERVQAEGVPAVGAPAEGGHVCVICERGWIFEGRRAGAGWTLAEASVVRRWDNGLGIGGLAKAEHKDDYTLDPVGEVTISERAVIASFPLEW